MSRSFRDLLKVSAPFLLVSVALTGCGGGSGGTADLNSGSGNPVVLDKPVTVTETFDFRAPLNYFVIGDPPIHARFLGGVANDNGAWIVRSGTTATINFATPADAVKFSAIDNYTAPVAAARSAASKTAAQKLDPPYDAGVFVRGTELGWDATADKQMTEVADNTLEVTLPLTTASTGTAGEFKIADAGWSNLNCGANSSNATIAVGTAYEMSCGTNPPNVKLNITADGNYKFHLDATGADKTKPILTITNVTSGGGGGGGGGGGSGTRACGLTDQGLDNTSPFGATMFVRGSVKNDWAAAPENQLIQFGGDLLKVELQVDAGDQQFKVADAGWSNNCGAGDSADVTLGTPLTMACGTNPGNLKITIPAADCYEFAVNAADKTAPVVTVKKANLSTGGGGTPADSAEIRIYGVDVLTAGAQETLLKTIKGSGTLAVDQAIALGGDPRITRIEIQNLGTNGDLGIEDFSFTANPKFKATTKPVDIYYTRPSGGYATTTITIGGKSYPCTPTTDNAFGCVVKGVPLYPYQNVSMDVDNGTGGATETIVFNADTATQPVYSYEGSDQARVGAPGQSGQPAAIPRNANEVILFYKRKADDYTGWGVHLFPIDPATEAWTTWTGALQPEGVDPQYGAYFRITLPQNANPAYSANPGSLAAFPSVLGFIIHKGDTKDPGPDQQITIAQDGNIVFVVSGINDVSSSPQLYPIVKPKDYTAHWVTKDTVLWKAPGSVTGVTELDMLYSPDGTLANGVTGIIGNYAQIKLGAGTNPQLPNMKHLSSYPAYSLGAGATNAKAIARSQIWIVGKNVDGITTYVTRPQIPGALDDLYAATAKDVPLGPTYSGGAPTLRVWAPTALTDPGVSVELYDSTGALKDTVPMTLDTNTGVWSVQGDASWNLMYYRYKLRVYAYDQDAMSDQLVADPYSVAVGMESPTSPTNGMSEIVNLDDPNLKPTGWDNVDANLAAHPIAAPEDIVLYELHVRDFSINDPTVPAADRGKYNAFDDPIAAGGGRAHLQQLAQAGLTHVHILPAFDIASVDEDPANRVELDSDVAKLCAANPSAASLCPANNGKTIRQLLQEITANGGGVSQDQQQIIEWLRGIDGFNWGYDPYLYGLPEGSYATNPDGPTRILEFRRMVKGLSEIGLRTVMDVVYNHTSYGGTTFGGSVLDRIVPGYYYRRDPATGNISSNSCCRDTQPEFAMMEKLTTDTAVRFARDYKVHGFRFDIMGFHPVDSIERLQTAVKAVNPDAYIYGEGWNFGDQVQNDKRFVQATQAHLAGTGIGSFNDRIRDAVRGGGCCDSGTGLKSGQGFISGLWWDPNDSNSGAASEKQTLLSKADQIRVSLAGGLKSYTFENSAGTVVAGTAIDYGGQPAAYTDDPSELVNYVEAHDNMTLWDVSQVKQPAATSTADRVRAQNVGTSVVLLAQGVPFLHAGQEILRSKSGDTNSYDSGDWYNEIDWTLATSNWAIGLPRKGDNGSSYTQLTEALSNPLAASAASDRQYAFDVTKEWLEVRKSSTLFRLRTADQIKSRMTMLNTGTSQVPGVVAYKLDGCDGPDLTDTPQPYGAVVTIFNPTKSAVTLPLFGDETFTLHPVLANSVDPVVKTATHDATGFTVPARTTAVFVKTAKASCSPYGVPIFVRGINADWNTANSTNQMQFLGGAAYSASLAVNAGAQQFKIADGSYSDASNCGGAVDGVTATLANPVTLTCGAGTKNVLFNADATASYTFSLDATSTVNPVLTVSRTPPFGSNTLYVRGGFNSWDASAPMTWDGLTKYRAEILNLAAQQYEFKIADFNYNPVNCGGATSGTSVTIGQPYALACTNSQNVQITIPAAGSYLFTVTGNDPAALSLSVEQIPFTAALYVRGLNGDWASTNASTRMSYLGGGIYSFAKSLAASATAQQFKIADANYTDGTNCGLDGGTVAVGTPLALKCVGPGNGNLSFTVGATGRYVFSLNATSKTSPALTVTGP